MISRIFRMEAPPVYTDSLPSPPWNVAISSSTSRASPPSAPWCPTSGASPLVPASPTIRSCWGSRPAIPPPPAGCCGRGSRRDRSSPTAAWTASASSVTWELADDEAFARSCKQGRATAAPELGYSRPRRTSMASRPTGGTSIDSGPATRRAPSAGFARRRPRTATHAAALRRRLLPALRAGSVHGVRSTWRARSSTSSRTSATTSTSTPTIPGRVRQHNGLEIRTLDDYRRRYAQYKADPLCRRRTRAARGSSRGTTTRWTTTTRASIGENGMESEEQMRARRAAGYQAWWEHQPVRVPRARVVGGSQHHAHVRLGRARATSGCWTPVSIAAISRATTATASCRAATGPTRRARCSARDRSVADDGLASSRRAGRCSRNQVMVAPYDTIPAPEIARVDGPVERLSRRA